MTKTGQCVRVRPGLWLALCELGQRQGFTPNDIVRAAIRRALTEGGIAVPPDGRSGRPPVRKSVHEAEQQETATA